MEIKVIHSFHSNARTHWTNSSNPFTLRKMNTEFEYVEHESIIKAKVSELTPVYSHARQ